MKGYNRRIIVLAIVTPLLLGILFVGNTEKVYADVSVDKYGQVWFTGADAMPGGAADQRLEWLVRADEAIMNGTPIPPDPVLGTQYSNSTTNATAPAASAQPATSVSSKGKVTATFKNMYGVIIGTSKITAGTDIAKSQFPKSVPDIVTSTGTYVFDHWDYDGTPLTDDISVKAIYRKAN